MTETDRARAELATLYQSLSEELDALGCVCSGCGRCCHFEEAEHILFATRLEIESLVASHPPAVRRPAPGRCPYQSDEACHARESRPLGCRLHFCRPTPEQQKRLEELSAEYHHRLQELHQRFGLEWSYRPVLAALEKILNRDQ